MGQKTMGWNVLIVRGSQEISKIQWGSVVATALPRRCQITHFSRILWSLDRVVLEWEHLGTQVLEAPHLSLALGRLAHATYQENCNPPRPLPQLGVTGPLCLSHGAWPGWEGTSAPKAEWERDLWKPKWDGELCTPKRQSYGLPRSHRS